MRNKSYREQGESEAWLFEVFEIMDNDCDGLISKQDLLKMIKLYDL
jgi:Ca2+-binding EF-hand superfamily protein